MVVSKVLCALCGAALERRSSSHQPAAAAAAVDVLDELAAAVWVQAYDTTWLSQDWTALQRYLAPDVAVMLPGFSAIISGRAAVLAHIRAMVSGAHVHEYNATDLTGHTAGTLGVITHRWQLDWTVNHKRLEASGRDILVLRRVREGWQQVWRAEAPRLVGADVQSLVRNLTLRTISA